MSAFTGERLTRDGTTADLWAEHIARYAFAATFAPAARALDIGCGTGYGSARLSHVCGAVTALDVSRDTIAAAAETYALLPNLRFLAGSGENLPFRSAAFDLVTAFEVIEHIDGWSRAMDEVSRVLAPGGVALMSTPNRAYYTASRGEAGPNPFHVHEFDYKEFRDELQRRFPSVTILLQNWTQCLAFYPHRVFPPVSCDIETTAGEPEQAHFFLAVCSHEPLADRRRSYVHVPRGANVLREREAHIAALDEQLRDVRGELSRLIRAHDELNSHLEKQNQWGLQVSAELDKLRAEHAELQNHLEERNRWALDVAAELDGLRKAHAELQSHLEAQNRWALGLSQELDRLGSAYAQAQADIETKNRWALDLSAELESARKAYSDLSAHLESHNEWARALEAELHTARTRFEEMHAAHESARARIDELQNELAREQASAQAERARAEQAETTLAMTRESRWVRLGRLFRVGPDLSR